MNLLESHLIFIVLFSVLAVTTNGQDVSFVCPPCGCSNHELQNSPGTCSECGMALEASYHGVQSEIPRTQQLTAAILIFDHADIMDVTGPWSVFVHNGVRVVTVSKSLEPVRIGMSMDLTPDYTLKNLPKVDVIMLPGSGLAESNPRDPDIQEFIKTRSDEVDVLFSVCSGAFFLAESGLLDKKEATTFASFIPIMSEQYPQISFRNDVKYVDNGKTVTSAGLSSGIDATFHVISKFRGQGTVQDVANHMEYEWTKPNEYARSQLAVNYLTGIKTLVELFSNDYISSYGDSNQWELKYQLSSQKSPPEVLKIIKVGLSKYPTWVTQLQTKHRLTGVIEHPVLGKGKITIQVIETDKVSFLLVNASRSSYQTEG